MQTWKALAILFLFSGCSPDPLSGFSADGVVPALGAPVFSEQEKIINNVNNSSIATISDIECVVKNINSDIYDLDENISTDRMHSIFRICGFYVE